MEPAVLSSRQNPLCKLIRSLDQPRHRREHGLFIVPGRNAITAALKAGWPIERLVVAADEQADRWMEQARAANAPVTMVDADLLAYLSDLPSAPEALALARLPGQVDESPLPAGLTLVLDRIGDPGNVGTLIRSADAAGASAVVLTDQSADAFGLKAVRASVGSLFHLPPRSFPSLAPANLIDQMRRDDVKIIVAAADGAEDCFNFAWPERAALVLGHESQGVAPEWEAAAAARLRIPMFGRAESLNVAAAGAVLLYAWRKSQGA
jgi:TrmH family RNA methyltransferase